MQQTDPEYPPGSPCRTGLQKDRRQSSGTGQETQRRVEAWDAGQEALRQEDRDAEGAGGPVQGAKVHRGGRSQRPERTMEEKKKRFLKHNCLFWMLVNEIF